MPFISLHPTSSIRMLDVSIGAVLPFISAWLCPNICTSSSTHFAILTCSGCKVPGTMKQSLWRKQGRECSQCLKLPPLSGKGLRFQPLVIKAGCEQKLNRRGGRKLIKSKNYIVYLEWNGIE